MNNEKMLLFSSHGENSALFIAKYLPEVKLLTRDEKGKLIMTNNKQEKEERFSPDTPAQKSVIIRWGAQIPLAMNDCVVYNRASAIRHSSNKKQARKILAEHGISVPKYVTKKNFSEEDLPILARPSHHSKCKNMIILRTKEKFLEHYDNKYNDGWYYSKIIDKEHEYRIHCAHGKILAIQEKPKPRNETTIGWGYAVIDADDWRVLLWEEYNESWCREALKAMDVLGLDFGAIDVITKGDKMYILEVNTAGCLTESKILKEKYSKYFKWLFGSASRRKHFDYAQYKQKLSLTWKENNFKG